MIRKITMNVFDFSKKDHHGMVFDEVSLMNAMEKFMKKDFKERPVIFQELPKDVSEQDILSINEDSIIGFVSFISPDRKSVTLSYQKDNVIKDWTLDMVNDHWLYPRVEASIKGNKVYVEKIVCFALQKVYIKRQQGGQ